jgi:hypothetical protein
MSEITVFHVIDEEVAVLVQNENILGNTRKYFAKKM